MNESDIKEMFREEREGLDYEREISEENIGFYEEEYVRIEKFLDVLNKLPGSNLIEKVDRNELYDLRKYYATALANMKTELNEEKEILAETNQLFCRLLNISVYFHTPANKKESK